MAYNDLRDWIAALDRGDNDDLALQSFIQKYGTTVVAAPSTTGFGRVAWIMPFVALAAGYIPALRASRVDPMQSRKMTARLQAAAAPGRPRRSGGCSNARLRPRATRSLSPPKVMYSIQSIISCGVPVRSTRNWSGWI